MGDERAAAGVKAVASTEYRVPSNTMQPLGTGGSVWPMKRGGQ